MQSTTMKDQLIGDLRAMDELFTREDSWCKGDYQKGSSFCALGAAAAVTLSAIRPGYVGLTPRGRRLFKALECFVMGKTMQPVSTFNDSLPTEGGRLAVRSMILQMIDAIEREAFSLEFLEAPRVNHYASAPFHVEEAGGMPTMQFFSGKGFSDELAIKIPVFVDNAPPSDDELRKVCAEIEARVESREEALVS